MAPASPDAPAPPARALAAWRWWARCAVAAARLLPAALRSGEVRRDLLFLAASLRARRRRGPAALLPARDYLRWRCETATGDPDAFPHRADVLAFARWARTLRAAARPAPPRADNSLEASPPGAPPS